MKSAAFSLWVTAAAAIAATPPAPSDEEPWPDSLELTHGTLVRCRIRTASPSSLVVDYPRPGPGVQPTLSREVPWSDVRAAEFAMDKEFHRLVAARDPVRDTPRLAARWSTLAPLVERPKHPAGDLGLTLARLSLTHPEPGARHRALDVCRVIAAGDWNPARRHQARLLVARILAALGRGEQAVDEARRLTTEPEIAPEAAMPARVFLAEADFAALRKLQEEHPRWEDDDAVRPEREALFHQALESALIPSLFHGALEEPASQGLWTAVQLLEFDRNLPAAADTARDLLKLYPATSRAAEATAFLGRHGLGLEVAGETPPPAEAADAPPSAEAPALARPAAEPVVHRRRRYAESGPALNAPSAQPDPSKP